MRETVDIEGLHVDPKLHRFLVEEVLPGTGVDQDRMWRGLSTLIHDKSRRNRELLDRRVKLQSEVDAWHRSHNQERHSVATYRGFLERIGYLEPESPDVQIRTKRVDREISEVAGPQLIVPVMNARYALNAANARWGSLYDALYGTDALGDAPSQDSYDADRGARVIGWVRDFLDDAIPLEAGSHADVVRYAISDGRLHVEMADGALRDLRDGELFAGYRGEASSPEAILFRHHRLHIELVIDSTHPVGSTDSAGVADVVVEAAITAIIDCEDSVAAVDCEDKIHVYRNWLGLMKGDLVETFTKSGELTSRSLASDRYFVTPEGNPLRLPGRALLLVRTVGHLMTTDAVIDRDGNDVPEGLLDAFVTVLAAMHDFQRPPLDRNSQCGSIYVVKPKMHGPDEVAFADEIFSHVEEVLGLPPATVKIGLMDEERRTSLNLARCIDAVKSRIVFINTGFLDRTGDEIHTSMEAGLMVRKADMKNQMWLSAYEDRNVDIGLASGLRGRGQIGKGMWAAPDLMGQMLQEKINHPMAGASCAWVPSPTAATLHATHYHRVDVHSQQEALIRRRQKDLDEELAIPIAFDKVYSEAEVADELENNAQGILGYVVRWINEGIGCSKVPDIHDISLMEDRATCRISSQHIANWLRHGLIDTDQVISTMKKMAVRVDEQNSDNPGYVPMGPGFEGVAFQAACDLILMGPDQPSGYTEPILHARRREQKRILAMGGEP